MELSRSAEHSQPRNTLIGRGARQMMGLNLGRYALGICVAVAILAALSLVLGVALNGRIARAADEGQVVTFELSPCGGKTISSATVKIGNAADGAPVQPFRVRFQPAKNGSARVSMSLQPGYYDAGIRTPACEGGTRFAILAGFDRAASVELRPQPKPHQITSAVLWGPTLAVIGVLPKDVLKAALYSVTRGSYGGRQSVYVDHGAYYADRIGPDRYILILQAQDGRRSQIALDVSEKAYTLQRRDVSENEYLSALGVLASPYHRPEKLVRGLDGNMWFLDRAGNSVGRVSENGDTIIFRLPSFASAPADIAAGTDSIWVTETATDSIARVRYGGRVTAYRLPARPGRLGHGRILDRIVLGSDSRMWFSERAQPYLGAIDNAGTIAEYPLGQEQDGSICLVSGMDGRLWFGGMKRLGAMDTSGRITMFPSAGLVVSMTAGKNGIWVDNGDIVHVTPDGKQVSYQVPLAGSSPLVMAEGLGHELWFVDQRGDTQGSVDSAGKVAQSYVAFFWPARIKDIVVDANGRLWIAEPKQNTIYDGGSLYFPPHRSDPTFLSADRSDDIWFTSPLGSDVGVVRKNGQIQCFSVDPQHEHYGCAKATLQFIGSTALP
jgi:streptogramin lyase